MEQVNDASIALPQRFELASRAMAKLTGIFLSEALAPVADAERSVILSRLTIHLKAIIDTLARNKEIEASDAFDLSSPKFQTCVGLFLEVVHEAVIKYGVSSLISCCSPIPRIRRVMSRICVLNLSRAFGAMRLSHHSRCSFLRSCHCAFQLVDLQPQLLRQEPAHRGNDPFTGTATANIDVAVSRTVEFHHRALAEPDVETRA
jgi:hypothetical protein